MSRLIKGVNDLKTKNPSLAKEWHPTLNGSLSPEMVTAGSSKKVYWLGPCGHEWQATVASRNAGVGCPICARESNRIKLKKTLLKRSNTLFECKPELVKEWHPTKNGELTPMDVGPNSHDIVWWKCKNGHEWKTSVKSRNNGSGCPFCYGSKVIIGETDLKTVRPEIAKEWDYDRNKDLLPENFSIGSNKRVWWKGSCGHEWQATIKSRSRGAGCPFCSGKIVLKGFNDLKTQFPDIAKEWNYDKNGDTKPENIMPGSHTRVWWKCEKGHEWEASPNHRTSKSRNCPFCCHNPQVIKGETDLSTRFPEIAKEWNYDKNGKLTPDQVTFGSSKRVWWKCALGHEWRTSIEHRTLAESDCPRCASALQTSFPEQAIYYYVKRYYPDAINGYKELFRNHGMELDIYIPSVLLGIEYDGVAFHSNDSHFKRERKKYEICKQAGINLIRIRENQENKDCDTSDVLIHTKSTLDQTIISLEKYLPKIRNVNVERDINKIRKQYLLKIKQNSILQMNPELVKEWDYERNENLTPDMFAANSNVKVWWKCNQGHEWQASIYMRNGRGTGCPYCSNSKILSGYNDLCSCRPDLMKEWNWEKNKELDPAKISPGSGKKAWWLCAKCGNEWLAEISSRNKGSGCPNCGKQKMSSK